MDGSLFADNLAIYITTRNQGVAARVTNKLDTWAVERGVIFSLSRTIKHNIKKRKEEPIKITLRYQIIPYKESAQSLKMTLDSRFNWEEHIDRVRAKAKRAL